jgi:hypothetical protein
MGTNYFLHSEQCPHCGIEQKDKMHLGKSSAGWCFGLHVYPDLDLIDWHDMWSYISFCVEEQGHEIKDECGETILPEIFFAIVWDRHAKQPHDAEWLRINHAQPGPFDLARHLVDGQHCIGNAGPYAPIDYIVGEFS